jgi:hypothetical protein
MMDWSVREIGDWICADVCVCVLVEIFAGR